MLPKMPEQTALYPEHKKLGARLVDFNGWELPLQYGGIIAEHKQCRQSVALFDTCHMGRFLFSGPRAGTDLARLLTADAAAMPVGKCRYCLLLNEEGGILDDTIVMRLGDHEYLLVVNAGPASRDFAWISSRISGSTKLTDQTRAWGKLDVQGPGSSGAMADLVDFELAELKFFSARRCRCLGVAAVVSRTGYTGELGYEVFMPGEELPRLFRALIERDGVAPAGLGARDLLRLEMCFPLYGLDIDSDCNPVEADLGRFVSSTHEFIGARALRGMAAAGTDRKLIAFKCAGRRKPLPGSRIVCGEEASGTVTSGAFSPALGVAVGMGYAAAGHAAAGTELTVCAPRHAIEVTVADKPLYTGGTCRTVVPRTVASSRAKLQNFRKQLD